MRSTSDHNSASLYKPSIPNYTMTSRNMANHKLRNSSSLSKSSQSHSLDRNREHNFYQTMTTVPLSGLNDYNDIKRVENYKNCQGYGEISKSSNYNH